MSDRTRRTLSAALALVLCASIVGPVSSVASTVPATPIAEKPADGYKSPAPANKPTGKPPRDPYAATQTTWTAPAEGGEVLVVLEDAQSADSIAALREAGGVVEPSEGTTGAVVVRIPKGTSRASFAREIADAPGVAWVQPNYTYRALGVPNDPEYSRQWGLPAIGAPAAWDVTRGKSSVTVAVVDSGVSLKHPDLIDRVDTLNDYDFVNGDTTADDDHDHGTHVAGTIAATADNGIGIAGVAPLCRILPIKVLDASGNGTSIAVANGIRYAADNGADIINLSLGGSYDEYTAGAVRYAQGKGCLVIAATGNDGEEGIYYPAKLAGVIGVGAVDRNRALASFSNYGTGTDIVAPGVDILSTVPGAGYAGGWKGTSMATPFVSGVAALVASAHEDWSAKQISDQILNTALDLGPAGRDDRYGKGLVRADRALTGTVSVSDDEIPGVPITASPVTGGLSREGGDLDDVYAVFLGKDQTLTASLSGQAGTDFDLFVFPPYASDISDAGQAVARSVKLDYPETISYKAPAAGVYYLDAYAAMGTGSYSITWSVAGSSDDNIPGVAIRPSPFIGNLGMDGDTDDVYRVRLEAGQQLTVRLGLDSRMPHSANPDFDLWLFGPGATDVGKDAPIARRSTSDASEFMRFVAPETGDYYLDAWAYSGWGHYRLEWLIGAFSADDNIPGVALPASSPISGTVGGLANPDDVYKVYLQAGQRIDLSLTMGSTLDHDLYLYGPEATDTDVDQWVAASILDTGLAEAISVTATSTGFYYVDVFNARRSGPYTLSWSIAAAPDDAIPGVDMPASPVSGELGATTDTHDVYRLPLAVGQNLVLALDGPVGTDFVLSLYEPGTKDTRSNPATAIAKGAAYPKRIRYAVPVTGEYYVLASAYSGDGEYRLSWATPVASKLTKASPGGSSYTVRRRSGRAVLSTSARLVDTSGTPIAGKTVKLQRSTNGSSWTTVYSAKTGSTGLVKKAYAATRAGTFYLRWFSAENSDYLAATAAKTKYRIR